MNSMESRVKLIHSESADLQQYLDSLALDAWSKPSTCDLWTVGDVVAHLVWVAEFYLDTISRGISGDSSAPEGRPPADALTAPSFDEYLAQRAIARRESLGDQLLQSFHARYHELNQLLAKLAPDDWEKPCAFWRGRTISVTSISSLTVQELAMHGWDMRSEIESSAQLSAASIPALIERIPQRPVPWRSKFATSSQAAAPIRYRFDLDGLAPSQYDIVIEDNFARMELAEDTPADIICKCEAGLFVLLMYGRLTLDAISSADQLTVENSQGLLSDFDRWLKGAERPG